MFCTLKACDFFFGPVALALFLNVGMFLVSFSDLRPDFILAKAEIPSGLLIVLRFEEKADGVGCTSLRVVPNGDFSLGFSSLRLLRVGPNGESVLASC